MLFTSNKDNHGKMGYSAGKSAIDLLSKLQDLLKAELDYYERYYSPSMISEYSLDLIKIQAEIKGTKDTNYLSYLKSMERILISRITKYDSNQRALISKEIKHVEERIRDF
ncbi:hypothetical protein EHV15_36000 [Paenibacillus oralis]|uniref:Uncharacterized protein n=1 Tax=Paenibacillus oralis TaxID=2490856 RepID=A0A3P3TBS3_9BACL|nr:hypothetical protein [Paenibacillus oralis]RRJ54974.1 hypothetical protein EHV15_36000 [Paenibacillus oralis]